MHFRVLGGSVVSLPTDALPEVHLFRLDADVPVEQRPGNLGRSFHWSKWEV